MARTLCDLWLLLKSRCALWFLFAIAALVLWNDWWKSPWRCRLPVLFFVSVFAFVLWKLISLPELQIRQGTLCTRFWHEQMPRAWPILLFFTALTMLFESFGWFQHLEATFLDMFIRGQSQTVPTSIFIVEITDGDYKNFFGEKSPLEPGPVLELIRVIRQGCPSVIGVDLDTQDGQWATQKLWDEKDNAGCDTQLTAPEIIWAEVPQQKPASDADHEPCFDFTPVLGRERNAMKESEIRQIGVVLFPLDVDGIVRRHQQLFSVHALSPCEASDNSKVSYFSSFYHVVNQRCTKPCSLQIPGGPSRRIRHWMHAPLESIAKICPPRYEYFNFSGGRYSFQIV